MGVFLVKKKKKKKIHLIWKITFILNVNYNNKMEYLKVIFMIYKTLDLVKRINCGR